jgi:hypothetical protein
VHLSVPILALALLFAVGCGQPAALTVHNGYASTIRIEGLPSGPASIDSGQLARFEAIDQSLSLIARDPSGNEVESVKIDRPVTGGESLWNAGGGACFVFGDFSLYYTAMGDVPASARVLSIVKKSDQSWTSKAPVAAGPGQRLPKNRKGSTMAALVQVPCEATISEAIAQGWLEMRLPHLQPTP